MEVLDDAAVQSALRELPGWARDGDEIVKTFQFDSFPSAIGFVNRAAEAAEAANHHPDIDIRYSRITCRLTSHDSGGLTAKDTTLARRLDQLAG
jgi:4a-hydroxytetrahydrobiopterin dehydratase